MRVMIWVAILLAALTPSLPSQADARQARVRAIESVLRDAQREQDRGQLAAAQRRLRAGVQRFAGEPVLLARYAELALPLGAALPANKAALAAELRRQITRAHGVAGERLALPSAESERLVSLHEALAEALLGALDRALALAVQAGQLQDPQTVACLRQIAAAAVEQEQLLQAEQALGMARQYMPQDAVLPRELARVLLARGKAEVASQVLSERLAIDSSVQSRADFAYTIAAQGRAGEALARLIEQRADCLAVRSCALLAGRVALEAGRPQEAVALVEPLAQRGDLDALFLLADAQRRAGAPGAARAAYERVLQQRPDSVRARQGLEQLPPP